MPRHHLTPPCLWPSLPAALRNPHERALVLARQGLLEHLRLGVTGRGRVGQLPGRNEQTASGGRKSMYPTPSNHFRGEGWLAY